MDGRGTRTRRGSPRHQVMRLSVLCILGSMVPALSYAGSYLFFRPSSSAPAVLANEHFETGYSACHGVVGLFYDPAIPSVVLGASYNPSDGSCVARLDTSVLASVTLASLQGSCPGDVEFDFLRQRCVDAADLDEIYGVLVAFFAWSMLIGGMVVGAELGR